MDRFFFFFSHSLRIYSQVILEFEAVFDQWDFFLQSLRFILNTRHILSQQFFNIPIRFFSLVWNFLVFKLKRIREMLQFSFRQALNSIFKYSIFVWSFYKKYSKVSVFVLFCSFGLFVRATGYFIRPKVDRSKTWFDEDIRVTRLSNSNSLFQKVFHFIFEFAHFKSIYFTLVS